MTGWEGAPAESPASFPLSLRSTLVAAAAAGALSVLGFAPLYWSIAPMVGLAGLFGVWSLTGRAGRAFAAGYAFGLGFFLAGVSWVYVSMHDFGGMAVPIAAFATTAEAVVV